ASGHMDFIYRLGGVHPGDDKLRVAFRDDQGELSFEAPALVVDQRINLREPIFAHDFAYLQEQVTTATPKLTIPSPSKACADQVAATPPQGCWYLQFDDTSLAYLNDPAQRAILNARGDDAEHQHLRYIRQINAALSGRPEGLRVTTHLCRGNYQSSWAAEGSYDFVAEALFGELAVDGFFLEYD